jgi:uncharacterized protein (DUF4415 family)
MAKKNTITRVSAEQLAQQKSETDWTRAKANSTAKDTDEAGLDFDWNTASIELPQRKTAVHVRLDQHILDHFRASGRGYQTRINAVLAAYVRQAEKRG